MTMPHFAMSHCKRYTMLHGTIRYTIVLHYSYRAQSIDCCYYIRHYYIIILPMLCYAMP